jgi:magnesium-transporting ATPase (P-type)
MVPILVDTICAKFLGRIKSFQIEFIMAGQQTLVLPQPAYSLPPEEIARHLSTDLDNGISQLEATHRHALQGPNSLETTGGVSIWKVFLHQVANALTLVSALF